MGNPNMWNAIGQGFGGLSSTLMGLQDRQDRKEEQEKSLLDLAAERKLREEHWKQQQMNWDAEHKLRTDKAALDDADRKNQEAYQQALHERTKPGTAWTEEVPVAPPMENSDIESKPYSSFLSGIPTSYTEEHSGAAAPMEQEERIALASQHGQVGSSAYNAVESGYAKASQQELAEERLKAQAEQKAEMMQYLKKHHGEQAALAYARLEEQKRGKKASENIAWANVGLRKDALDAKAGKEADKKAAAKAEYKKLYDWAKANPSYNPQAAAALAARYKGYKNKGTLSGYGVVGKLANLAMKNDAMNYNAVIQHIMSEYEESL
jgi:hypothetical protein